MTTGDQHRVKVLERENRELRRTNEILRYEQKVRQVDPRRQPARVQRDAALEPEIVRREGRRNGF